MKVYQGKDEVFREWMNKQQTVERFTADLKTVSLFNIILYFS